jgi:hypothetical protein
MTEREHFEAWKATLGPQTTSIQDIDDCMWLMAWAAWQARATSQPSKSLRDMTEADFDDALGVGQPAQEPVAEPCCGEWMTCQKRCVPLAQRWRSEALRLMGQPAQEPALRVVVSVDESGTLDRHHFDMTWLQTPIEAGEYLYYAAPPADDESARLLAANRDLKLHFDTLKSDYDEAVRLLKLALPWCDAGTRRLIDAYLAKKC